MSDLLERFAHEFGRLRDEENAASDDRLRKADGQSMDPILRQGVHLGQGFADFFQWGTRPIRAAHETYKAGFEEAGVPIPRLQEDQQRLIGKAYEGAITGGQAAAEFVTGDEVPRESVEGALDIATLGAAPLLKSAAPAIAESRAGMALAGAANRVKGAAGQLIAKKAPAAIGERLLKPPKLAELPAPNILDDLRGDRAGGVVDRALGRQGESLLDVGKAGAQKAYDVLLDQNAPFERLDRALGVKPDPGIGMGTGEGFGAEAAARQGTLRDHTAALVRGGWYNQSQPFKARGLPYHSMEEAASKLGAKGYKDAGNYLVARRELTRYHGEGEGRLAMDWGPGGKPRRAKKPPYVPDDRPAAPKVTPEIQSSVDAVLDRFPPEATKGLQGELQHMTAGTADAVQHILRTSEGKLRRNVPVKIVGWDEMMERTTDRPASGLYVGAEPRPIVSTDVRKRGGASIHVSREAIARRAEKLMAEGVPERQAIAEATGKVVGHEYVHHQTLRALERDAGLAKEAGNLAAEYRKHHPKDYAATDGIEFIAEAMSKPEVQANLAKLAGIRGGEATLMSSVRAFIGRILERAGLKRPTIKTLLDESFETYHKAVGERQRQLRTSRSMINDDGVSRGRVATPAEARQMEKDRWQRDRPRFLPDDEAAAAEGLDAMFSEEAAQKIVAAVEGDPKRYKAVLDVEKQYVGTMEFLADELERVGKLSPAQREAWRKHGPYVHLSRVMDPDLLAKAGKGGGSPFARVKGYGGAIATENPLRTFDATVKKLLAAIDEGRFARDIHAAWEKNPDALAPWFERSKKPVKRIQVHQEELAAEMKRGGMSAEAIEEALVLDEPLNLWRGQKSPRAAEGQFVHHAQDGKEAWFQATPKGQELLDVIHRLDTAPDYGAFSNALAKGGEVLAGMTRAGITQYNPGWWLYQLGSDGLGAWSKTAQGSAVGLPSVGFYKNAGKGLGGGMYEAVKNAARPLFQGEGAWSEWMKPSADWERFRSSGSLAGTYSHANPFHAPISLERAAMTGNLGLVPGTWRAVRAGEAPGWVKYYFTDPAKDALNLKRLAKSPREYGARVKETVPRIVVDPLEWYGRFGEISESALRVGEHMGNREMLGLAGQATDVPIPRVDQLKTQLGPARVTMAFQRGGTATAEANRIAFPFLKATANAFLQEGKLLKHMPKQYAARRLTIAGLGAAFWWHNKDKERFKDAADYEKGGYMSLYFDDPVDIGAGPVSGIHLMAAREDLAAFKAMEFALTEVNEHDPAAAKAMAYQYMKRMSYSLLDSFVLAPFYEAAMNKKLFSDSPINPPSLDALSDLRPEEVAYETTPEAIKKIVGYAPFQWLSQTVRFTDKPMTATQLEHLVDSLPGPAPLDALGALERVAGFKEPPEGAALYEDPEADFEFEPRDASPVGRLFARHNASRSVPEFFDRFDRVKDLVELKRHWQLAGEADKTWKALDLWEPDVQKKSALFVRENLVRLGRDYRKARTNEARMEIANDSRFWAQMGLEILDLETLEGAEKKAKGR